MKPSSKARLSRPAALAAALAGGALSAPAWAQLRIVTMNPSNSGASTANARTPWMTDILTAIGSSVSDDPTLAGSTGIAKPIDILALQESHGWADTATSFKNLLHTIYPSINYQVVQLNGATTGSGTQSYVYNADALQLVSQAVVGVSSNTSQPRQAIRAQFRPMGYSSSADFYLYNSHYKAGSIGDDPANGTRRNDEAVNIRADVNMNTPAGANIIYLGDLNVYTNTEPMYQTLTAAGNGQAIDPINKPGSWTNNSAFKNIHTQSPWNSVTSDSAHLNTGFNGTSGGLDDRFDQQMITANVNDGHGVAYVTNSYQAFGNNGTHTFDQPIDYPGPDMPPNNTAQPANILNDLAGILDHLPVVADYQIPAKMTVTPASIPSQVITGGTVTVNLVVSNSAAVSFANGADTLTYSGSVTGALTGTIGGNDAALGAGITHILTLSTSGTGAKSGTIAVTSTSEAVANGTYNQNVNYTVLDHANGSFSPSADMTGQSVDFGYVPIGSATRNSGFSINNRAAALRAGLDLDLIQSSGDTARLTTNAATFSNLAAGSGNTYSASLNSAVAGNFAATYTFKLSDQDLPGAANRPDLVLTQTARVFSVANFPVTGFMFLPATEPLTTGPFSIQPGVTLTKTGPGTMTISGAQNNGALSQLVINDGLTNVNTDAGSPAASNLAITVNTPASIVFNSTQHLAALNLNSVNAAVSAGGAKVVVTNSLNLTGSAKLDLADNDLIVRGGNVGTWNGSAYTAMTGLIATGRNGGNWSGLGLVTTQSTATTSSLTTLGIAQASDVRPATATSTALWNGETITGSDVLVMYTYGGDANLDGKLNIDDYVRIDQGIAGGLTGWSNGDFNFDGKINIDDYTTIIDSNIGNQGPPLGSASGLESSISPVPEPMGVLLILPPMLATLRRSRRDRRIDARR